LLRHGEKKESEEEFIKLLSVQLVIDGVDIMGCCAANDNDNYHDNGKESYCSCFYFATYFNQSVL